MTFDDRNATDAPFCYPFMQTDHKDVSSLARALAEHWQEGKKEVFSGALGEYLSSRNAALGALCRQAQETKRAYPQDEDWIFINLLRELDGTLHGSFGDAGRMKAFGKEILQALRSGDFSRCDTWNGILRQNILSGQKTDLFGREQTARIASLPEATDERTQILNAYALGFFFAGEVSFVANGVTVKTIPQLTKYMKSLLDISYDTLEEFCHTLIDYNDVLDVQLEAFLVACGKQAELLEWKNSLK